MSKMNIHRFWLMVRTLRWAILALVAGIGGGIALLTLDGPQPMGGGLPDVVATQPSEGAQPWYQAQTPPPTLPNLPDEPIFFEDKDERGEKVVRAYEEALPQDVYVPQSVLKPAPVSAPMPEPASQPAHTPPAATKTEPKDAWQRYAVAAPVADGRPRLVIVIDDMGVDHKRSEQVVNLPGPLTLSYLTYARDIQTQTAAAQAAGHELMLHVSMEPHSHDVDPGPNVLQTGGKAAEVRDRLTWGLSRFEGFVGINNHMGSKFTEDPDGMAVVMTELKKRGLLFLDSRTTAKTVGRTLALETGVPVLERNVFLDHVNDTAEIAKRLDEAEAFAHRHGVAIAIGHPRPATIHVLTERLPELAARGIQLVPLTALLSKEVSVAETP